METYTVSTVWPILRSAEPCVPGVSIVPSYRSKSNVQQQLIAIDVFAPSTKLISGARPCSISHGKKYHGLNSFPAQLYQHQSSYTRIHLCVFVFAQKVS